MKIEDFITRTGKITSDKYQDELEKVQFQLLQIQLAIYHQQKRAIVLFEGWDAAGKGGCIQRMVAPMDPRGVRVHLVGAPTPEEQGRHYLYRFFTNLPKQGRLAVFDRSWYGRVLVERVEKLTPANRIKDAYEEINQFEKMLTADGILLCKIFLNVSKQEQLDRLEKRLQDPAKRWKLTADDFENVDKRDDYNEAMVDMLEKTSSKHAPWQVFDADHKKTVRIEVLRRVVKILGKDLDVEYPQATPEVIKLAKKFFNNK